ncbi:MAG: hypothetical protein A2V63_13775 [Candidatus Eisenbacteria bacterium RBG_19FT_COMBO_70_11]|nr:MAG: hypothetical protein A2V63_13775 [Candidatus Eisenbacteria bacterium RBG_19FT_COMBO_70_11]
MKIRSVKHNNRKKAFEVKTSTADYQIPYSKVPVRLGAADRIARVFVDPDLAREGFTYVLASGEQGTVHMDQVLEYNRDPSYLRNTLLYRLTVEAQKRTKASLLSKREIIRRLGTSATQLYRLLDQTNDRKSVDRLLALLQVLDCEVTLTVRARKPSRWRAA